MQRMVGLAFVLIAVSGCMPGGGELGASTSGLLNLVPDPSYRPREGDRATLFAVIDGSAAEQIAVLSDMTAYDKYERFVQADEAVELANMEQQGWLQYAAPGTSVLVVKIADRQHTGAQVGAEVKLLDGSHKGRVVWTQVGNLARMKRPDPVE